MNLLNWLRTEYKRAVFALPSLFLGAVILAVIVGMIVFGAYRSEKRNGEQKTVTIGYTAQDDALTQLAVSYIQNMESVQGWCSFVPMTQQEGKQALEKGEIAALLVLPEQVVEGIMDGSNEPARLYLPEVGKPLGLAFEELADAGIGMLQTAQAEIYTTMDVVMLTGADANVLSSLYDEINRYNLNMVMNREQLFKKSEISRTGNEGAVVYYSSALLTLYMLLAGLFLVKYGKRSQEEQLIAAKRLGISYVWQFMGRTFVIMGMLGLSLLFISLLWLFPVFRDMLHPKWSWNSVLGLILVLFVTASYIQFLYQLAEQPKNVILTAGIAALVQGYVAGCFLPTSLLPEIVGKIDCFVPASCVKSAFTMLFTGNQQHMGQILAGLMIHSAFMGMLCVFFMRTGEKRGSVSIKRMRLPEKPMLPVKVSGVGTSVFSILYRRLLHKKSFWLCLGLTLAVSVGLVHMEKQSDTTIYAAFYDESGIFTQILTDYKGLVRFVPYGSREEVCKAVLYGKAECGYDLPSDLQKKLIEQNANRSIQVYEDGDAMLTGVVNEVIFEKIFTKVSAEWYQVYLTNHEALKEVAQSCGDKALQDMIGKALSDRMTDGSTFTFERQIVQPSSITDTKENRVQSAYPVRAVVSLQVILCGALGVMQAISDYHAHRFYKQKYSKMAAITVLQPVLTAVFMGILILAFTNNL